MSEDPDRKALRPIEKRVPVLHLKALTAVDAPGTFESVFAVFGNEDRHGETVEPGAFKESWAQKMPKVVWSHNWLEVPIGVTLDVEEIDKAKLDDLVSTGLPEGTNGGAWAKARLLVDIEQGEDHPEARKIWSAMKATGGDGRSALNEFSWGGRVEREETEKRDGMFPLVHLLKVDQTEWGPCLKGANPATALVAVKALLADGELSLAEARKVLALPEAEENSPVVELAQVELTDDHWIALRALLKIPAETGKADVLDALRAGETTTSPFVGDEQQRARVLDLLLS